MERPRHISVSLVGKGLMKGPGRIWWQTTGHETSYKRNDVGVLLPMLGCGDEQQMLPGAQYAYMVQSVCMRSTWRASRYWLSECRSSGRWVYQ